MRAKNFLAGLVGFAILAIGGAAAWTWIDGILTRTPDVTSDPSVTVAAYLDAWESGDVDTMLSLLRDPTEDFPDRIRQLSTGLGAERISATAGTPVEEVDGRVRVPVQVDVTVAELDTPVSWDVTLRVIRDRGDWGILWELAIIHPELRPTWEFSRSVHPVDREAILAADGTVLSGVRRISRLGFEPRSVTDPERLAEAFERVVPGTQARVEREFARDNLVDTWFYPVVDINDEAEAQRVWDRLRGTDGVVRRFDTRRALLSDGFAQHVVGVLAEATAEQIEQREAAGEEIAVGDLVPQFGLELARDDQLEGSELLRFGIGEPDTPVRVVIAELQVNPSSPVGTTIDVEVQRAVEAALDGIELPAGFVVLDANDGAIRAAASRPLNAYNRAFSGRYPPGSTFKIVTTEALIAAGAQPDDAVGCPAETVVGGLRIPNAGGLARGETTLRDAFAFSCNTTFASLGASLGAGALSDAAQRFGFDVAPRVPLSVFGASFPAPQDAAETGAASFGQARVEASVLHMASVAAAGATGTWHQPYLLADEGSTESHRLSAGADEALRDMMRAVVVDGSGTAAAVDGLEVFGKTGTAQATGGVEHAWFVGVFGDLAFAVLIEDGGSGGTTAAPLAARFVTAYAQATGALAADRTDDSTTASVEDEPDDEDEA